MVKEGVYGIEGVWRGGKIMCGGQGASLYGVEGIVLCGGGKWRVCSWEGVRE